MRALAAENVKQDPTCLALADAHVGEIETSQPKFAAAHIPSPIAGFRHDLLVVCCSQATVLGCFEGTLMLEWQATAQRLLQFDRISLGKLSLCIKVLPCRACLISVGQGVQYCLERSFKLVMITMVGWPISVWSPKPKARACESGKPGSGLPGSPAMAAAIRGDG